MDAVAHGANDDVDQRDADAAAPATEARAPEAYVPVQSLGYVVFDWSEADGLVPGFGPLPSNGHSIGAQ